MSFTYPKPRNIAVNGDWNIHIDVPIQMIIHGNFHSTLDDCELPYLEK